MRTPPLQPLTCCPQDAVHDPIGHRDNLLIHVAVHIIAIKLVKAQRTPGAPAAPPGPLHVTAVAEARRQGPSRQR